MSLIVVGGTGFLGKELCKYGLNFYKTVTSISRNQPSWDSWWVNKVHFKLMPLQDLFSSVNNAVDTPNMKRTEILNANTVIYSVGTLFASSLYKKAIKENDISVLPRWIRQEFQFQSNGAPLYDTLHYQYPLQVFNSFKEECKHKNPYFVYISAHSHFSDDIQYIKTKRLAEEFFLGQIHKTNAGEDIKIIIARPGLMYNESNPISMISGAMNQVLSCSPLSVSPPLRTTQVAESVFAAIDQNQTGILEVEHLQELAK
eukprot:NODE_304_length_10309_cov_0.478355.p4 type:complete len:258 gc:universal NODE_304_length_10309_cov_0.478355:2499-1726(-)